jgi:hypothetical protein
MLEQLRLYVFRITLIFLLLLSLPGVIFLESGKRIHSCETLQ